MRILTGSLRGQSLEFKPNPHLRPTSDKVRKALFDTLQGAIEGKAVLDLFSGTGALGFEALSNGAEFVDFIERDKSQAKSIERNLERLNLSQKAEVLAEDVLKAISKLDKKADAYDYVFLDPPYEKGLAKQALNLLVNSKSLEEGALIVLECRKSEELHGVPKRFTCLKNKVYGDTRIMIYRFV